VTRNILEFGGFMFKQIRNVLLLGTILLLFTGCTTSIATPTVQLPTPTTQPVVDTATPIIIIVTATALPTVLPTATDLYTATPLPSAVPPTAVVETQTPVQASPVPATKTQAVRATAVTTSGGAFDVAGTPIKSSSSIIITSIKGNDSGKAQIIWTATGNTSNGFLIFYSTSFKTPFLNGYPYYKISDGTVRSGYVDGTPGMTYYYRICDYTGSSCDFYSNSYTFTYAGATPTP
jgi:hypothetical protein